MARSPRSLGFEVTSAATGRPAYHPAMLLKLYIYGYLNRTPSSRRLEREAGRNVELMWLTCKLAPDHKTISNFRKDHGLAIQAACAQFRGAVSPDRPVPLDAGGGGRQQVQGGEHPRQELHRQEAQEADGIGGQHIAAYLQDLDTADRQEGEAAEARAGKLKEKIAALLAQMQALKTMEAQLLVSGGMVPA